jgi:hypothetical protein
MELAASRSSDIWKKGALAVGACILSLWMAAPVQAATGNAGVLVGLLIATAVTAWYLGRGAGLATTVLGAAAAAYFFLPPIHSWEVIRPQDSGALYAFTIGGVILSLLGGATWQLRAEARSLQATENELTRLRSLNSELLLKVQYQGTAISTSDRFLKEFARTARAAKELTDDGDEFVDLALELENTNQPCPEAVDCNILFHTARTPLPTVWADQREMRRLFEVIGNLEVSASQLPEWWLFVAGSHNSSAPLTSMQRCICERIVVRQGGRWWTVSTNNGGCEIRFLLPRREPEPIPTTTGV